MLKYQSTKANPLPSYDTGSYNLQSLRDYVNAYKVDPHNNSIRKEEIVTNTELRKTIESVIIQIAVTNCIAYEHNDRTTVLEIPLHDLDAMNKLIDSLKANGSESRHVMQ